MGGTSFLLNKKFHPGRLDNQKKVFIAEQNTIDRKKNEDEAAKEVLKETEVSYYENLGEIQARDPRNSALKFMYSMPSKNNEQAKVVVQSQNIVSGDNDDMVKSFWAKIDDFKASKRRKSSENFDQELHAYDSVYISESLLLSSEVGGGHNNLPQPKNSKSGNTKRIKPHQQQHPLLINAPTEGAYVKTLEKANFKPFNDVIRNIQCSRCGEWGHRFGDRECSLRDYNPHDYARQQREDPMTYMNSKLPHEKQKQHLVSLYQATLPTTFGKAAIYSYNNNVSSMNDEDDSDPEAEFIASLTTREKKLLLRKLEILERNASNDNVQGNTSHSVAVDDSSSTSSSSSSEDSDDDCSSDIDTKELHMKKSKKKSKHKRKSSKKNTKSTSSSKDKKADKR